MVTFGEMGRTTKRHNKEDGIMSYELKAIKMAGGEETPRFEAKIHLDGKEVGTVYNEGCGGPHGYSFIEGREAEARFLTFAEKWGKENDETFESEDVWVYKKIEDWEERKSLLRMSKKKSPFRLKGDPKGEWRFVTAPYSEKVQDYLNLKYGDKIEMVFNREAKVVA